MYLQHRVLSLCGLDRSTFGRYSETMIEILYIHTALSCIILLLMGVGFLTATLVAAMMDTVDEKWAFGFLIAFVACFIFAQVEIFWLRVMGDLLW